MSVIDRIKAQAKTNVKHIVLAEGSEPRTVQAAAKIVAEGLAKITLVGDPEEIQKVAAQTGTDLKDVAIVNPAACEKSEAYAEKLCELRQKKGMTVVLITHHMDEAAQAQRVVVLHKGQVALDGLCYPQYYRGAEYGEHGVASPDEGSLTDDVQPCLSLARQSGKVHVVKERNVHHPVDEDEDKGRYRSAKACHPLFEAGFLHLRKLLHLIVVHIQRVKDLLLVQFSVLVGHGCWF